MSEADPKLLDTHFDTRTQQHNRRRQPQPPRAIPTLSLNHARPFASCPQPAYCAAHWSQVNG